MYLMDGTHFWYDAKLQDFMIHEGVQMFEAIIEAMKKSEKIDAIMLGGSRGNGTHDEKSDYDVYVYLNDVLTEEERRKMIGPYVKYMEYSNHFWELEDDGILKNGIDIEFIYRNLTDLDKMLEAIVFNGQASTGYTTCFWDNLIHGECLYDPRGLLGELLDKYTSPYPEALKKAIIYKNAKLLKDHMPAFYYQFEKAIRRNDLVSINHRMAELLASYFDILFALNEKLHPGEKRLLQVSESLVYKPEDFEKRLTHCLQLMYQDGERCLMQLASLIDDLYDILIGMGYQVTKESYKRV